MSLRPLIVDSLWPAANKVPGRQKKSFLARGSPKPTGPMYLRSWTKYLGVGPKAHWVELDVPRLHLDLRHIQVQDLRAWFWPTGGACISRHQITLFVDTGV